MDLCPSTMESSSFSLFSVCLAATIERIEKERKASVTDNVPSFLSGTQDLNTTITKMRTKADALVKGT